VRNPEKTTRIAFDTNAFRQLCEDQALNRAALHRLRERVKCGKARVISGYALIAEVAGLAEHEERRYLDQMRELRALTDGRILLHWVDRAKLEIRHRRRLSDREAFRPTGESRDMFLGFMARPALAVEESKSVQRNKEHFARGEREAKAAMQEDEGSRAEVKQWRSEFARAPDEDIDRWFIWRLRTEGAFFGVTGREGTWPKPHQIPTLRADTAYHMAHHFLVGAEARGRKQSNGTDFYDNQMFVDAVYADLLVTNDRCFHNVVKEAGASGVRLQHFNDWAIETTRPEWRR
jgi:hypothetical protein